MNAWPTTIEVFLQLFVSAPVWAVLLVKITTILMAAWLVHLVLLRANPRWRILLWRVTAVSIIALVPVTWLLPAINIRVAPALPVKEQPAPVREVVDSPAHGRVPASNREVASVSQGGYARDMLGKQTLPRMTPQNAPLDEGSSSLLPPPEASALLNPPFFTVSRVLLAVWLSGMGLLACRLGLGSYRIWRMARSAQQPPHWVCQECLRVALAIGCRTDVDVLQSLEVQSPLLCGFRRSRLLLPAAMCEDSYRADLPAIFAHELAHVRSRDVLWNFGLHLISVALWFHPFAWRMRRAHMAACELVSDAVSASFVGDVTEYCRTLARVAVHAYKSIPTTGIAMARRSSISRRLSALKGKLFSMPLRGRSVVSFGLAALFVVTILGLLHFAVATPPVVESTAPSPVPVVKSTEKASPVETVNVRPTEPPTPLLTAFGKVVDPAGKPVAAAKVCLREWSTYRVSQEPYNQNPNDILATTQTDLQGEFRFKNVPAKPLHDEWLKQIPWDIVVVAKPYALAWRHLNAAQQSKPMTIALTPETKITGRFTDQQGRPIRNAEVKVSSINALDSGWETSHSDPEALDLSFSRLAPVATTDADGKVAIAGLPRELLIGMGVTHDDFRRKFLRVATTDRPQPDIEVPDYRNDKTPTMQSEKVYSMTFSATLEAPLPRLVGRVIAADSKKPLPQTMVDPYGRLGTMTDQDGRFVLKEIRDARCRLIVWPSTGTDYLGRLLFVDVSKEKKQITVDIELPRGEIVSGTVADEETGKGVVGVTVGFESGFDVNTTTVDGTLPGRGQTDREGRFRLAVPHGKGKVRIVGPVRGYDLPHPGYRRPGEEEDEGDAEFAKNVEVIAGKPTGEVKFTVRRIALAEQGPLVRRDNLVTRAGRRTVEGVVTDPDGKPVAGAQVGFASWFGEFGEQHRPVQTDQNGRFTFKTYVGSYQPNEETLVAFHRQRKLHGHGKLHGHAPLPDISQGEAAKTPVEIHLCATGAVTGRVLEDDNPIAGAQVMLNESQATGKSRTASFTENARADENGRFEFPLVEAGNAFDLMIFADHYMEAERHSSRVQVVAGQTLDVKPFSMIRLDKSVAGTVVDPDGNPVAGVTVSAEMRSGGQIPRAFTQRSTGGDGRFTIRGVPNVPLTIMAYIRPPEGSKDNRIHFSSRVEAEPGQTDVRIVLDPKLVRGKK